MTRDAKRQSVEAIEHLRSILKPGDIVYTVLRSISRSGMSRNIDLYVIRNGEPQWISSYVGQAIGSPQSYRNWENSQGLTIRGAGMDTGFHLVYSLGRVLFPDDFHTRPDLKKHPETVEYNAKSLMHHCIFCKQTTAQCTGVNYHRNGDTSGWDNDGGYALQQRWL